MDNFAPIAGNMSMADAIQSLEQSTSAIINSIIIFLIVILVITIAGIVCVIDGGGQAPGRNRCPAGFRHWRLLRRRGADRALVGCAR